jgi:predicted DNA-binding helix-hairpin-helix protein
MDTLDKLQLLADGSQYDLACAGCTETDQHRKRSTDGNRWLYPVSLPSGGKTVLLKTLLSNVCTSDCKYCPFRNDQDVRRCSLTPDEIAKVFMQYARRGQVTGLFLSSGILSDADTTMDRLAATARILRRRYRYGGYVHMKIIPGASKAAIDDMLSVADSVSLNVEVPTAGAMAKLSTTKNYHEDIVNRMRYNSRQTAKGSRYQDVRQTTQFIVGAAGESDRQIVDATFGLYKRLKLDRVFFSAFQGQIGDASLAGSMAMTQPLPPGAALTREHRLYQTDFLMRRYRFDAEEIPTDAQGRLSLEEDPKMVWARQHPEFFPLDINRADRYELLRVPGLGPVSVKRILAERKNGGKVRSLAQIGRMGKRLVTAQAYLKF